MSRTNHPSPDLISVEQAIQILDQTPVTSRTERIDLSKAQYLRLAEDIFSDRDYPPFDKSQMDGYALRSADAAAPTTLHIIETIPAGATAQRTLAPGQAAAIMTGAPIPPGADAVIPVEQTTRHGDHITINVPVSPGHSIAPRASDVSAGQLLLPKGTRLGPPQIAVAASVGAATVSVYARPKVAVLSTGDELIDIEKTPTGAQIRNANTHMLVALLRQLDCDVTNLGSVPDDREQIKKSLSLGLESDALFVTGGMSMGERDYVPGLLHELGLELRITKLKIKPGKPFVFATKSQIPAEHAFFPPLPSGHGRGEGPNSRMADSNERVQNTKYVFGLPGNPVSAYVCTVRLAARLLSRIAGGPPEPQLIEAKLKESLPQNGNREFYQPARLTGSTVQPLKWKSSADIFTLAIANALIIRPENAPAQNPGDPIQVLSINRD